MIIVCQFRENQKDIIVCGIAKDFLIRKQVSSATSSLNIAISAKQDLSKNTHHSRLWFLILIGRIITSNKDICHSSHHLCLFLDFFFQMKAMTKSLVTMKQFLEAMNCGGKVKNCLPVQFPLSQNNLSGVSRKEPVREHFPSCCFTGCSSLQ